MKIENLFGESKTYNIGGEELTFKPLNIEDVKLFTDMSEKDKSGEALHKMIVKTFKESYPDIKEEDINKISLKHLEKLTTAIIDVNGLEVPDVEKYTSDLQKEEEDK